MADRGLVRDARPNGGSSSPDVSAAGAEPVVRSAGIVVEAETPSGTPLNEGQELVVTSTASTLSTQDATVAVEAASGLVEFRANLARLIDQPKPAETEDLPSRLSQFSARLFTPWSANQTLGYEELCARYVALWSVLERPAAQRYVTQALLGLRLTLAGRLTTASKVLSEIEFQTSAPAALSYVMRGVGYFLRSIALLLILLVYLPFVFSGLRHSGNVDSSHLYLLLDFLDSTAGHVLIGTVFGMLGSVVSLLLRLGEFEKTKGRSQMFLTLTGATLPVVGGMFGAFITALLSSKLINVNLGTVSGDGALNVWLCLVIGFLSGFSERFSRGFIQIAEDRLGAGADHDPQLKVSTETVLAATRSDTGPRAS